MNKLFWGSWPNINFDHGDVNNIHVTSPQMQPASSWSKWPNIHEEV